MQPTNQFEKQFVPSSTPIRNGNPEIQVVDYDNTKIYIKQSSIHGIGVFAKEIIKKDDIIEVFPIVPMSFRTHYQGDARIVDYSTIRFCECEECKRHGYVIFMRFGYGGLYNHQDNHNAFLAIDYNQFYGKCVATTDIEKDDEIFINYGDQYVFREGKNSIRK
jgi:SET domain-containing protein